MYGKQIAFTYKGEEQFKTFIGGFISSAIIIVMLLYFQLIFRVMIGKKDTNKQTNGLVRNLQKDFENLNLEEHAFSFAFNFKDDDFNILSDQTYVNLEINSIENYIHS